MNEFGKFLVILGVIIIILGVLLTFAGKLPFIGRLPGDIVIERKNFVFYFPLATSILLSIIISIILSLLSKK
jgi:hypothetical protein